MEKTLFVLFIVIVSFLTNIVWENLHSSFYSTYSKILSKSKYFICTIMDALIILVLYLLFVFLFKDFLWIKEIDFQKVAFVIIVGGITGVIIEKVALSIKLWSYNKKMPRLPVVNVGLWPVLQLMVLPITVYYISFILLRFL